MNKKEFLRALEDRLYGLPKEDVFERLDFYSEMIDDIIEEGNTEEEAVAKVGDVDKIMEDILSEYPISKLVKQKIKPKRELQVWETALIVVTFPLWFTLIVATFSIAISLYASVWAVIISIWAGFVGICAGAATSVVSCIAFACLGHGASAIATLGASLVLSGLAIFAYYGCLYATKGLVLLSKKLPKWIKACLLKGGADR